MEEMRKKKNFKKKQTHRLVLKNSVRSLEIFYNHTHKPSQKMTKASWNLLCPTLFKILRNP